MADNRPVGFRIVHYGLVLLIVCGAASLALGYIFRKAQPNIENNEKKRDEEALQNLYSDIENVEFTKKKAETDGKTVTYREARKGDALIGYVASGSAKGYSSEIKVLVRTDIDITTVEAIKVTSSQETPGLGERIKETKSSNTLVNMITGEKKDESGLKPWFQEKFKALPVTDIALVASADEERSGKGVLAISGATVSSTGVVNAVNDAVRTLNAVLGKGTAK